MLNTMSVLFLGYTFSTYLCLLFLAIQIIHHERIKYNNSKASMVNTINIHLSVVRVNMFILNAIGNFYYYSSIFHSVCADSHLKIGAGLSP